MFKPCPICETPGRAYGKKTCGAPSCIKEWKSLEFGTKQRKLFRADLPLPERMLFDQAQTHADATRGAAAREQLDAQLEELETEREIGRTVPIPAQIPKILDRYTKDQADNETRKKAFDELFKQTNETKKEENEAEIQNPDPSKT